MKRLLAWLRQAGIALDQLSLVILAGPFFLFGLTSLPLAIETISARVGREARAGHRWAIGAEWLIDRFMHLFGVPLGHCARSAARVAAIEAAVGQ